MGRAAYIRKRLILMVFVLFGVTIVIFGMVHFLPGDPAAILLGDRATAQNVAELHEQLGLNRPLPEQYWLFVSGLVRGQMGTSLMFRQPVSQLVLSRVPISIGAGRVRDGRSRPSSRSSSACWPRSTKAAGSIRSSASCSCSF